MRNGQVLYFCDQTLWLLYIFHHAIYCGYYLRAATNQRWRLLNKLSMNKEVRKRIGAPHVHKRSLKFSFSTVWCHHNPPDKMVRNCQSHYCHKRFHRSRVTRPLCLNLRKCQTFLDATISSPLLTFTAKVLKGYTSAPINHQPFV